MTRTRKMIMLGLALAVAGCATPLTTREKGALAGGAIGAGAGAAIGSTTGHAGTGALIGAGVGAVSGALIGDAVQANEQRQATPAPPAAAPPPPPQQVTVVAPPPVVVPSPQLIWVPQWGVYVLDGHDIVYHGGHYYYLYAGRWYVSGAYTGPWAIVSAPPPVLVTLPPGQFHRQLPPGLQKKGKIPPGHMR